MVKKNFRFTKILFKKKYFNILLILFLITSFFGDLNLARRRKKSNVEVPTLINGTTLCENKTMSGVQIIIYYGKRYIFKPAVYKTASSSNGSFYIFINIPGSKQNGNLRVFSFSKCGERHNEYIFEKRAYSTTIEYKYKILITTLVWSLEDVELSGKKGENRNARNVNWIN